MEIYLVKGKTICLSDLKTVACSKSSSVSKKVGRSCIKLQEQSLKPLCSKLLGNCADQSFSLLDKVAKFLDENNREAANKIWLQFVSIPPTLSADDEDSSQECDDESKLEVRLRGDLLLDFHSTFGKDLRFTVEITSATVIKDTEDDFEREPSTVPRHPSISNIFRRLFSKGRSRRDREDNFGDQELRQQLQQPLQQHQQPPPPPPRAPWRQPSKTAKLVTKTMKIVLETGVAAHFKDEISFPKIWLRHWPMAAEEEDGLMEDLDFVAKVNIIMSIVENNENEEEGMANCHKISDMTRRLLQDQVRTDLEIVAGNGAVLKCYSGFLVVQSEVLKTMLNSHPEMEEAQTSRITMVDISEEGLSAFLAYLYYRNMQAAEESSQTAVELLQAGRKYLISYLEDDMKSLLLGKPKDWFAVDAALTLFFFASKLEQHSDLAKKAVKILKSNPGEVKKCPTYCKLFHENPVAGRELSDAFLEFPPNRACKLMNLKKF